MSDITKRIGLGRPMTWGELDGNFDTVEQLRTESAQAVAQSQTNATAAAASADNALTAQNRAIEAAEQVEADISRTLKAPAGEVLGDLPSAVERQDKLLGFDSSGQPSVISFLPDDNVRELWFRTLAESDINLVDGSFEEGATVTAFNDAVWSMTNGKCYTAKAPYPRTVAAGSTPDSTWTEVSNDGLSINKTALARVMDVKQSDVGYLNTNISINKFSILYCRVSEAFWHRGDATGKPVNWSNAGGVLTLITTDGTFTLQQARAGDWLQESINTTNNNVREHWRRSLAEIGLTLVAGSVQKGAEVNSATEAVWDIKGAQCYTYTGSDFPQEANEATVPGVGWASVGGESLRTELLSQYGALFVKNSVLNINSVDEAVSTLGMYEGLIVLTNKYNIDVESLWLFTKIKPADYVFNIKSVEGYLILLTPNFASAGVIPGVFNPQTAWHNRNVIHKLLRDTRFNLFNSGCSGYILYTLGTIHPNRSNIKVTVDAGCRMLGRYDDPSIPESTASQTGEMFGFPIRGGYDSGNFSVTGTVSNIIFEILGTVSTEYSNTHSLKNNNNVIGFLQSNNCHVIGTGGIESSDHKGVCFDGDAINCHVELGFVKKTMDELVQIKGKSSSGERNMCSVKIGEIEPSFGGNNPPVSIYVAGCNFDVQFGSYNYSGTLYPVLVGAFGAQVVNVTFGHAGKCSQIVRQYNTEVVVVDGKTISGVQNIVTRGGDGSITPRQTIIKNIIARDNILTSAYREDVEFTAGNRCVLIYDNDFTPVSTAFKYIDSNTQPIRKSIYNNISRSGMVISEFNPVIGSSSRNVITAGTLNFTYNAANPDYNFGNVLICINISGTNYQYPLSVKAMIDGNITSVSIPLSSSIITVIRDGFSFTIATSSPNTNFQACVPFN